MRRSTPDHRLDRDERVRMAPGTSAVHGERRQSVAAEVVAVLRGARRLGVVEGAASGATDSPLDDSATDFLTVRRFGAEASAPGFAAAFEVAVVAFRVVRRFGAAGALDVREASIAATCSTDEVCPPAGRSGAGGFWPTWARSMASSSGGTSLHGSLDGRPPTGRGRSSRGRSRPKLRSSRGGPVRVVRPLTSG